MRQSGTFDAVVGYLQEVFAGLLDQRTGKNCRYRMEDAALSAFSVFFTQTASFLAYQRAMQTSKRRSNAGSLFGVHQLPSDNQIRTLLDGVEPQRVYPVFEAVLARLEQGG